MGTDIHIAVEIFKDGGWHLADVEVTNDRNYRAFAVLANVRNGYGFGGFSTGDELQPISEPRGLPQDLSPELRAALEDDSNEDMSTYDSEDIWLGDEPYSWVTLRELLDYNLDAPVIVRGFVTKEEAQRYRDTGVTPRSYAASVWSNVENFERMEWREPIRESAWLVPRLIEEISGLGDPDMVRLVFGFDS